MSPYQSLSEPNGSTPLLNAVAWIEGTLLGTVATSLCAIAIAAVGVAMLFGHLNVRRGAVTIIGCFILFAAREMANGLQFATSEDAMAARSQYTPLDSPAPLDQASPLPSRPISPQQNPFDPYAGASVPTG